MRLGLKTFLAAALAAALVVPGATAKPGNGNVNGNGGNGGGKPSWAGPPSDRGGGGGGGKPSWAGQGQATKAEKAAAKAERAQAKAERAQAKAASAQARKAERAQSGKPDLTNLDELTPEDLEGLNPAWTCKTERALLGDAFADEYGTNENDANAFGTCVSEEAHERDGVNEEAVEAFCEPGEDGGEPSVEPSEDGICPGDDSGEDAAATDLSDDEGGEEGDFVADEGEGSEDEGDGSGEPASILALLRSLF